MAYRKITVDGNTYEYVVGKTHLKIKGHSVVRLSDICSEDYKRRMVATPAIIAEYIRTGTVAVATSKIASDSILKSESAATMRRLQDIDDPEVAHVRADRVLCDVLKTLGYEQLVTEYHKVDKWFV